MDLKEKVVNNFDLGRAAVLLRLWAGARELASNPTCSIKCFQEKGGCSHHSPAGQQHRGASQWNWPLVLLVMEK